MPANPIALVVRPPALERRPVEGAPRLSQAIGQLLRRIEIVDEHADQHTIDVPVERPLTVLVDDTACGTLWTLGASPECLVLGYLWNQRLITQVAALESIEIDWEEDVARVSTRSATGPESPGLIHEEMLATTSLQPARISRSVLLAVLAGVPQEEAVYRAAGSVHGCALFRGAELWLSVEDVSRRNAIDTVTGWMALHGIAGADKILFTTGRFTAEIVMKAAYSGIPILISRKGLTATSYDLACRLGMTLFGHAGPGRYICYAGTGRFDANI